MSTNNTFYINADPQLRFREWYQSHDHWPKCIEPLSPALCESWKDTFSHNNIPEHVFDEVSRAMYLDWYFQCMCYQQQSSMHAIMRNDEQANQEARYGFIAMRVYFESAWYDWRYMGRATN